MCPLFQKAEPQNIRVWSKRRLIDQNVSTEKMEVLVLPQTHVKKVQSSGFFYIKARGKQEEQKVIDNCRHLGSSRDVRKTTESPKPFAPSLLTPAKLDQS